MVAAIGLLLGGNVSADGVTAVQTQKISDQEALMRIQQIREKISVLAQAVKNSQGQTITTSKTPLTQAELDIIQAKINLISAKIAKIKKDAEILAKIREIRQKISVIKTQVAAMNAQKAGSLANVAAVAGATAEKNQPADSKEARIAQIKQQIYELKQEMEVQKALEAQNSQAPTVKVEGCAGQECAAPEVENSQVPITISPKTTDAAENKSQGGSFWDLIGNFLRKIFTF